jgi:hypothetical protein
MATCASDTGNGDNGAQNGEQRLTHYWTAAALSEAWRYVFFSCRLHCLRVQRPLPVFGLAMPALETAAPPTVVYMEAATT